MNEKRFEGDWEGDGDWKEKRNQERQKNDQRGKFIRKKATANRIRSHSQRLLTIGVFGLIIGTTILSIGILAEFSARYYSLMAAFGGAFAALLGLYAFFTRMRISRALADEKDKV